MTVQRIGCPRNPLRISCIFRMQTSAFKSANDSSDPRYDAQTTRLAGASCAEAALKCCQLRAWIILGMRRGVRYIANGQHGVHGRQFKVERQAELVADNTMLRERSLMEESAMHLWVC